MPLNLGALKEVQQIYRGADTDQVCIAYEGRKHDPFFERELEPSRVVWSTPPFTDTLTSSGGFLYIGWRSDNGDVPFSTIPIPNDWIVDPESGKAYHFVYTQFLSRTRYGQALNVLTVMVKERRAYAGASQTDWRNTPPVPKRLVSSVLNSEWVVRIGEREVSIPSMSSRSAMNSQLVYGGTGVDRSFYDYLRTLDTSVPVSFSISIAGPPVTIPAPTIQDYQAAAPNETTATSGETMTINRADLPKNVTLSATIANASSWNLYLSLIHI